MPWLGTNHRRGPGLGLKAKSIAESPVGVDHNFAVALNSLPVYVAHRNTVHKSLRVFCHPVTST